jgi:hypothetical protein
MIRPRSFPIAAFRSQRPVFDKIHADFCLRPPVPGPQGGAHAEGEPLLASNIEIPELETLALRPSV